jgi:hypothetical protein
MGSGDGLMDFSARSGREGIKPFPRECGVALMGLADEGIAGLTCGPEEIREI